MAHNTTVFRQLLDLLPRHEFDAEARQHQEGQRLRVMSRWAQFVALGLGQLGGLQSLRDIVGNLRAQPHKLYHLGVRAFVSRSSLARVNAQQPYTLYEALFGRLLARCQQRAPRHGFRFKNKLYAVDASTIDLCLAAFPWASFRRTKGAIKLHVGVDQAGHLPTFISVTDGKTGDVTVARTWTFPAGSVVVADRAYLDFGWLHQLQQRGVTFVTRLKRNVRYQVVREHDVDIRTGVLSDQTIELTSARSRKAYPGTLRRVGYWDEETRRSYVFVTNNTTWVGKTIANLYKSRWQIELFFKWIKQHLKVKRFVGRTKNGRCRKERGSVATVGGDVYVPAVGLPEVRPATELEPAPDATSSPAQPVRPPSTGGAVHDALATGFPRPSDAAVALKMWDSSDGVFTLRIGGLS